MEQGRSGKHICIFECERKGRSFTGKVVCAVCGVYLSSPDQPSPQEKPAQGAENQPSA